VEYVLHGGEHSGVKSFSVLLPLFGLFISTAIGTLLVWLLTKPISGIAISLVNAFWAVAIAQGLSAVITIFLGYLLANHLGLGLILATIVKCFIQATILRITAKTLPALKAYILALIVVGVDFLIVPPLVALVSHA
jgi:hypothetical protein